MTPTALYEENRTMVEAARFMKCSIRTIQRLLDVGEGPPVVRLSNRRRLFRRTDLEKWIEGRIKGRGNAAPSIKRAEASDVQ